MAETPDRAMELADRPNRWDAKLHAHGGIETREARWREFARLFLCGDPEQKLYPFELGKAYRAVYGGSIPAARAASARLMKNPDFRAQLREVAREVWEKAQIDEQEVMEHLASAVRANIFDFFKAGEGVRAGSIELRANEIEDLPVALQRNVRKLKVTNRWIDQGEGREPIFEQKVEIEIIDRLKAIEMVGRILGLFKETVDEASWEKIGEAIQRGQKRAQERKVTWDAESGRPVFSDE